MTSTETARVAPGEPGWQPKLVALDIDGTLLRWIDGSGVTHERVEPRVKAAVHAALDAGAHVVLASGRSPDGMTGVADLLELRAQEGENLWIVASNGAVICHYPPLEVVHEETFDAGPAVRAIMERRPGVRVAVEERGVGYRVSEEFPFGELSGDLLVTSVDDIVQHPVSRVIIRDPEASVEDFVQLAEDLGLHGTNYVVGWTAWLDIAPEGISKASGLQYVADRLGLAPEDALAIGDGRNDLEMFGWAGRAVAMGQAIDEVKQAADAVTDSVAEDGAAVEMERWFPRG